MAASKKAVFDVSKPGAPLLSAAPTSRPIIVSHDTANDGTVTGKTEEPVTPRAKKIVIKPLHDTVADDIEPTEKAVEPEPVEEAKTEQSVPEPKTEPSAAETNKPIVDDEKERSERAALVAKLVTDQTYTLPIETVEERRSKRAAVIGTLLIIILLLAWYNVALDARLLPNTFGLPHTGFFGAN